MHRFVKMSLNKNVAMSSRILFALNKKQNSSFRYNCWSCDRILNENELKLFFCPCSKTKILPPMTNSKLQRNYFEIFDLSIDFNLNKKELTKSYRKLMQKLHPDLFAQKDEIEKEYSAIHSSLINKAYRVLDSPIQRAIYILKLNGFDYEKEAIESDMDVCKKKILIEVMELNELLDEIEMSSQVESLEKKLEETMRPFQKELEKAIGSKEFKEAIHVISKMKYYKNIDDRLQDLKLKFNLNNKNF